MNNTQFRRLLFTDSDPPPTPAPDASATPTLGSKKSSLVPMTPRPGVTRRPAPFTSTSGPPAKKFRALAAPRGVKMAAGYTDRARARAGGAAATEDDGGAADAKAARIAALEAQVLEGGLSREALAALREEIAGGEAASTGLVHGLDRKLLARVRAGEDVLGFGNGTGGDEEGGDLEEELEALGRREVVVKAAPGEARKKGVLAPGAGKKRGRDEILAAVKAARKAKAEAQEAPLRDGRWKRVGDPERAGLRRDRRGREVLVTVDEDGVVKRMVRRGGEGVEGPARPDPKAVVLGAGVVVAERGGKEVEVVEEDADIFEGVGAEYDPLGAAGADDEDDDEDDEEHAVTTTTTTTPAAVTASAPSAPRTYFPPTTTTSDPPSPPTLPALALLRKAAHIDARRSSGGDDGDGDGGEDDDEDGNGHGGDDSDDDANGKAKAARLRARADALARDAERDLVDLDGEGG